MCITIQKEIPVPRNIDNSYPLEVGGIFYIVILVLFEYYSGIAEVLSYVYCILKVIMLFFLRYVCNLWRSF